MANRLQGYVEQGGLLMATAGIVGTTRGGVAVSSPTVNQTYPLATVTVYQAGTLLLATIFADAALAVPKTNPFLADSNAYWFFYAADGTYDITFSGGGITQPFSWPGVILGLGGSAPQFSVDAFGAVGDGVTSDHVAIAAAATALQANGGGELIFTGGRNYLIFTGSLGTMTNFSGLVGVNIRGRGATLTVDLTRVFTTAAGYIFQFTNCTNILVDGFTVIGPMTNIDIQSGTVKCVEFVHLGVGCVNVSMPDNKCTGILAGLSSVNLIGGTPNQNIYVGNLHVTNCWYGVACQYGPKNMTVENLRTDTIHRSLFIYGFQNVKARVYSKDNFSSDCMISSLGSVSNSDLDLEYSSGAESVARGNGAIGVHIQFVGNSAVTMRNMKIKLHNVYAGAAVAGTGQGVILISKYTAGGAALDTVDRGHQLDNLEVSGYIQGYGIAFFVIDCDPGCQWGNTLDAWRNIRFVNLRILDGNGVRMSCRCLQGNLVLDNVDMNDPNGFGIVYDNFGGFGGINNFPPQTGNFEVRSSTFANRFVSTSQFVCPTILDFAVDTPVYVGWSGITITNQATAATTTASLPAAAAGLNYRFIRTVSQTFRVDPNGTDTFRAGGAGKYISLDSNGTVIDIVCIRPGTWEVFVRSGTVSYEP